jgi:hypothetical protein
MSIKNVSVVIVSWKELSLAIKEEISDIGKNPIRGALFWMKVPSTVNELEALPYWADYCRTQDISVGDKVLVEA